MPLLRQSAEPGDVCHCCDRVLSQVAYAVYATAVLSQVTYATYATAVLSHLQHCSTAMAAMSVVHMPDGQALMLASPGFRDPGFVALNTCCAGPPGQ